MKIKINYDLLDRLKEANQGFSLARNLKITTAITSFASLAMSGFFDMKYMPIYFAGAFTAGFIAQSSIDQRYDALDDLDYLTEDLEMLYIITDLEHILKTENYKNTYSIKVNEHKIPYIFQERYFNVPVTDKKKKVSIKQEHILGTMSYEITKAKYKEDKVLKLVPSFT